MGLNDKKDFTIESIDPKNIIESDLKKIAEIEQDMWAREDGIGEYVKCTSCKHIDSKEDIFGNLANDIKILTVGKIEELLEIDDLNCTKCGEISEAIYDRNEYIEEIRDRYSNSVESFLTVYRDGEGEIRGFFDGYLDSFDNIYKREFKYYYCNIGKEKLKFIIESNTKMIIPKEILLCSALGIEEGLKNFFILYGIIKHFFENIFLYKGGNVFGIAESTIGSNTHSIYHAVGAIKTGIISKDNSNKNKGFQSDIFIHPGISSSYNDKFKSSPRDFLKIYSNKMKEVLSIA